MKAILQRSIIVFTAFLLSALSSRADTTSYAQILKEREAVLSEILVGLENRRSVGVANDEAIFAAQLALYSFRRDTASTTSGKIKNQEYIIKAYEKKLAEVKARVRTGLTTNFEILLALDPVLQARQVLEELKINEKKG